MNSSKLIRVRISTCENELSFSADGMNQVEAAREASGNFADLLTELFGEVPGADVDVTGSDADTAVRFDLAELDWLSSVALNELINMNRHAKSRGLRFVLENANENVRRIFSLTRLERMFEFMPDESIQQQA